MDIDHLLMRGSDAVSGSGLHERKQQNSRQKKEVSEEFAQLVGECGFEEASRRCGISETAAAKIAARLIKREPQLSADHFVDPAKIGEIRQLIFSCNTTSAAKITAASAGRFSEAEIRIVKAQIEKDGGTGWDC